MLYPIRSFIMALIIYVMSFGLLSYYLANYSYQPPVSIEIDAEMIGDFNLHQHNSAFQDKHQNNIKISDSINSTIDHQHFDNIKAPNDQHEALADNIADSQKIAPLYQPLPDIPEDLRFEVFSINILAKFYINQNGHVDKVELINPANIPQLNFLLTKSLLKWQFPARTQNYTQTIEVKFAVTPH